jgi:hypothetical protein
MRMCVMFTSSVKDWWCYLRKSRSALKSSVIFFKFMLNLAFPKLLDLRYENFIFQIL